MIVHHEKKNIVINISVCIYIYIYTIYDQQVQLEILSNYTLDMSPDI